MRVHSDGAVGPLLLAAVGAASIVLLVVSVLYACASKEDDERAATAASTVGQEAAPSDQDAYLKQQIRLIEERKRREWEVEQAEKKRKKREEKEAAAAAEEEDVRRRRRKQREAQEKEEKARVIEIELAETKRAEEEQRRLQEERRIALETKAEEERVAREQKERQGAAEQEAEDFPDIHDEGIDCESGGASRAIQSIETTESMIKEMAAGTYSPRSSQKKAALTVNTSTRAKPERRLSAMDSPYGRMLLKSPRKSHQSVAQLLYGAYPGLGIEVMQAFLHKVGVEFETDLGLIEEDDVQNLDADEFDADTKEKLWKAVVSQAVCQCGVFAVKLLLSVQLTVFCVCLLIRSASTRRKSERKRTLCAKVLKSLTQPCYLQPTILQRTWLSG